MQKIATFFILTLVLLASFSLPTKAQNNILFSLQRHTYIEGDRSISIGLRNAESTPYLVQASLARLDESSGVKQLNNEETVPFIITPPLHKLEVGTYYDWRVMFSGNSQLLPKDRESVYLAKYLLIPPSQKEAAPNVDLNVMRSLVFKIYYRPKSLASLEIKDMEDKLSFRRDGELLIVKNNSPLYLVFDKVSIGKAVVDEKELFKPLPPFAEQTFNLPKNTPIDSNVEWNLLDEYSFSLEKQNSKLN
ncbi:fimbrial biogenesis chaperone [Providencia rettgeri]|nr:molecular chaperone [Providencia rettgeri]